MSIVDEITRIKNCVKSAYTNCRNKGATLPAIQNITNLPDTISAISGSVNSKYGLVMDNILGNVNANGELQAPISGELIANGIKKIDNAALAYKFCNYIDKDHYYEEYEIFTNRNVGIESILFPDLEYIGNYAMAYFINYAPDLISVEFPKLEEIGSNGMNYAFYNNSNLENISFPKLKKMGINAMSRCFSGTKINDANFPILEEIGNGALSTAFIGTNINSVNLPNLQTAKASAFSSTFSSCRLIESVTFQSLTDIAYEYVFSYAFQNCTKLSSLYFPSLVPESFGKYSNQFNYMLQNVSGCTVHFPYCVKKVIQNWADITNGFAGSNTSVLFDLKILYINFITSSESAIFYINNELVDGTNGYSSPGDTTYIGYEPITNTVIIDKLLNLQEYSTKNINVDFTATAQKVTISTGVSGLDIKFKINEVEIPALEESTGNYIIKIIGDIDKISYFINGADNYLDAENVISLTGGNVTQQITMTPATVGTFVRPNLTSNGTLGGDSFAVASPYGIGATYPYYVVDSNTSTNNYWWVSLPKNDYAEFTFYNPKPLKVESLIISYQSNSTTWQASTIVVQGSNDNEKWEDLATTDYVSGISRTIPVNSNKYFKYHRLLLKIAWGYLGITDLKINAKYKE